MGELSSADLTQLGTLTESWFNEFFQPEKARRELIRTGGGRGRELEVALVRGMNSTIAIQSQQVTGGNNVISYDQQLNYVASIGAEEPQQYATLPFRNIIANGEYGRRLRANITAFSAVAFPIQVPIIAGEGSKAPGAAPSSESSSSGLSTGAIAGIAVAGAALVGIVLYSGYFLAVGSHKPNGGGGGTSNSVKAAAALETPNDDADDLQPSQDEMPVLATAARSNKYSEETSTLGGSAAMDKDGDAASYAGKRYVHILFC